MRQRRHIPIWVLVLLLGGLALRLSGVELALHEATEQDCTEGVADHCILCLAPSAVLSAIEAPPTPEPYLVPVHDLCVVGDTRPVARLDVAPNPGRSPPVSLPA